MKSSHQISTYRLLAISEKLYQVKKRTQVGKRRTSKYEWKGKEADQKKESQKELSKCLQKG